MSEEFPLTPRPFEGPPPGAPELDPEKPGVLRAVATFGASAFLGFVGLVLFAAPTRTCGSSRSAALKRAEAERQIAEAEAERDAAR